MREFIKEKMDEIFNDFKEDLNSRDRFCILKDFRFDGGHTPNYNNEIIQRYYLLKYIPAYLVEYKEMYKYMLQKEFIGNNLNVLSIGCGCGIDLWGLKFAIDDYEEEIEIEYTGLDVVDWLYWDNLNIDDCYYINDNIMDMRVLDERNYNVIMFPKSIGELDKETFKNLKRVFENTNFCSTKIVLLSSIRKTRRDDDIDRFAQIVDIFEETHGYECIDDKYEYHYFNQDFDGQYPRLQDVFKEYIYPNEIREFMTKINHKCQGYIENDYEPCEDKCNNMNRYPITRASQIEFQVVRLQMKREYMK